MSEWISLQKNASAVDSSPLVEPYSRVTILIDENTEISVGDDSGKELTVDCPWGTLAMANAILASLRGFQYQPYSASNALLNPAAEIGDGVTVNNVSGGIYSQDMTFGKLMLSNVSAPYEKEIDHEYKYVPATTRKIRREFGAVKTELTIQEGMISAEVSTRTEQYNSISSTLAIHSNEISAKVAKTGGAASSFGWSLTDSQWELYSGNRTVLKATASGVEVTGKITATSGYIGNGSSGFTIGSKAIYNGVTSMDDVSHNGIYLGVDGIVLGKGVFKVTSTGALTARSATLTGEINARSGTIGSGDSVFTINGRAIKNGMSSLNDSQNAGIYIGTDGIALGGGAFKVDRNGNLTANNGTFSGNVYASRIKSDATDGYGGYFSGSGLSDSSVSYSKTGFRSTLDQVGTNTSSISNINYKFQHTLEVNNLNINQYANTKYLGVSSEITANRVDITGSFEFKNHGVRWLEIPTTEGDVYVLARS